MIVSAHVLVGSGRGRSPRAPARTRRRHRSVKSQRSTSPPGGRPPGGAPPGGSPGPPPGGMPGGQPPPGRPGIPGPSSGPGHGSPGPSGGGKPGPPGWQPRPSTGKSRLTGWEPGPSAGRQSRASGLGGRKTPSTPFQIAADDAQGLREEDASAGRLAFQGMSVEAIQDRGAPATERRGHRHIARRARDRRARPDRSRASDGRSRRAAPGMPGRTGDGREWAWKATARRRHPAQVVARASRSKASQTPRNRSVAACSPTSTPGRSA